MGFECFFTKSSKPVDYLVKLGPDKVGDFLYEETELDYYSRDGITLFNIIKERYSPISEEINWIYALDKSEIRKILFEICRKLCLYKTTCGSIIFSISNDLDTGTSTLTRANGVILHLNNGWDQIYFNNYGDSLAIVQKDFELLLKYIETLISISEKTDFEKEYLYFIVSY